MKFTKVILAAGMATTLLAGCGAKNDEPAMVDGKAKVRFSTWDSSENLEDQQKLVDQFNESQDKIFVELEAYGGEYDTKIAAGMGAGDAPDVMYMWNYPKYYKALMPLDELIEAQGPEYKDNFYEALWPYNSIEGEVYGIPVGYTSHVLYYNKDIFDAAGVEYPTNDWTWDDLKTAAADITKNTDNVMGFAYGLKQDPYDFEMYLWSNGTAYSNDEGQVNGVLNSAKSVEVLQMFQDMEKEGIATAIEKSEDDEMLGGKAAMMINGAWSIGRFQDEGLNFGVVKLPKFNQNSISVLSTSGLGMSKDCKNKEAAFEFIKYWTGEEMNKARIEYELPALKSVVDSEKINDDPIKSVFIEMLEQSAGYTPSSFKMENWGEFSEDLSLGLECIINPSAYADVQTTLDELEGTYAN